MPDDDPVTGIIGGRSWSPGAAPVECGECGAELSLGESCDHLAHTEEGLTLAP